MAWPLNIWLLPLNLLMLCPRRFGTCGFAMPLRFTNDLICEAWECAHKDALSLPNLMEWLSALLSMSLEFERDLFDLVLFIICKVSCCVGVIGRATSFCIIDESEEYTIGSPWFGLSPSELCSLRFLPSLGEFSRLFKVKTALSALSYYFPKVPVRCISIAIFCCKLDFL